MHPDVQFRSDCKYFVCMCVYIQMCATKFDFILVINLEKNTLLKKKPAIYEP